ncbi:max-binding protein MNT-like isoform X2 [Sinocyclocheilus grahami]|uniref:max-binding protein MNT-like isoform X1 n=1 Tax=Sinocyclocheilus grahami TaxID=75366 RepID=UPI0007AD64B5|nr:PREDICTED: max-binding protein MNT-like isoform X1 [Sinocyclocheilus grahami]XP_016128149.1 PREDICTED: max-binding protein MNT-like isoform X2 [Sinocyclocheilus grahami]
MPITVIPIPVVSSTPPALPPPPTTALSPSAAPPLTPPRKDTHSLPNQQALHQRPLISSQVKPEPTSLSQSNGTKPAQQLQTYPGPIVTASQHALLPQPGPPSVQSSPVVRGSPPDDHRNLDGKKRSGGAGTREVHNKLEKNRRAHLKECFETLKKNIPNVDEKKTSNLSVLRSALRYIQTLKRKEKDYEHEMERLAREKIALQQRLAELKNELSQRLDVIEIDRVLRQTVQPDDDQASTSTASEGEDNIDEDIEDETPSALPKVPAVLQPDLKKSRPVSSLITQHIPIPHKPSKTLPPIPSAQLSPIAAAAPITAPALTSTPASAPAAPVVTPQTLPPAQTHIVTTASLQPSVIAHAGSASHASVIQAVNRVIQPGSKHVAHIAPSSSSSVQLAPGPQSISQITVAHLPAIYPQPVTVTQPTVMSRIAQTLSHSQMNGTSATNVQAKQTPVGAQMVTHHPQLVGQTVLNPVTMVTMPSFPVSTLKLA